MEGSAATGATVELERFLAEHPHIRHIDALFVDLCGIIRGKRYPRDELEKLFSKGLQIPTSIYLLDVTGESLDPCGRGFSDGDPDGTAVPVPGTLVPVPWADHPLGQVLMTMNDNAGNPSIWDPRNVAAKVLARFAETGLRPVVAFELEFYLLDRERDAEGRPQAPISPSTGKRDDSTQVYSITLLDDYAAFFRDVEAAAASQKVPCSVATTEYAPGQYEINLKHVADPLEAADHCALLRHIVKRIAAKHGLDATFMAKPHLDQSGNGMHLHMSLVDEAGNNAFDDGSEIGGALMRQAMGGLQATMAEAMAIFAPNVNAYRRFVANIYVPVNKSWGVNNRSFAFRIPAGPGEARRIEHRVAGADANPYLVLAAILAGLHHGISNELDPGEPWQGNASAEVDPDLPLKLEPALARLEQGEILPGYLSRSYVESYCAAKRTEFEKLSAAISRREYAWYL